MKLSEVKDFLIDQKLDLSKIKSLSVDQDKDGYCTGNAFCNFTSYVQAKYAMNVLCGVTVKGSKLIASMIMSKEILNNKNNDQTVIIKKLNPGVDEKMIIKVIEQQYYLTVMSVRIVLNKQKIRSDATITLESSEEAKELIQMKVIESLSTKEIIYAADKEKKKSAPLMPIAPNKRSIIVEFEKELDEFKPEKYQDSILDYLLYTLELEVASLHVWGKEGRHPIPFDSSKKGKSVCSGTHCKGYLGKDEFTVPDGVKIESGMYDCYLNPNSSCGKLKFSRRKAHIDFRFGQNCEDFFKRFQEQEGIVIPIGDSTKIRIVKIQLQSDKRKCISFKPEASRKFVYVPRHKKPVNEIESHLFD